MNNLLLSALPLASLPTFDWNAALFVGAIVTLVAAAVIVVAILTPFIAIQGGALLATTLAVAGISLVTGIIGGTAAGYYKGREADKKREEKVETIRSISNQLDIYFQPVATAPVRAQDLPPKEPLQRPMHKAPAHAEDHHCCLVQYEEHDVTGRQPSLGLTKTRIEGDNSDDFYRLVEKRLDHWFGKKVLGDEVGKPRRVVVYMDPFPGDGVYERLKQLCVTRDPNCVVNRVEGKWQSAIPETPDR